MPISLLAFLIVEREDLHVAVFRQRGAQIADRAVYLCGACGLIQPHADALCDFRNGNAAFKFFFASLEIDLNHSFSSFLKIKTPKSQNRTSGRQCAVPPEFMRVR